jgi:hypothetical protein
MVGCLLLPIFFLPSVEVWMRPLLLVVESQRPSLLQALQPLVELAGVSTYEVCSVFDTDAPILQMFASGRLRNRVAVSKDYPRYREAYYLRKEFEADVQALHRRILARPGSLIVAFGMTALWAVAGKWQIKEGRGFFTRAYLVDGRLVMQTYNPIWAFIKGYEVQRAVAGDIRKARNEQNRRAA